MRPHICPKIALINGLIKVCYPPAWTAVHGRQKSAKCGRSIKACRFTQLDNEIHDRSNNHLFFA